MRVGRCIRYRRLEDVPGGEHIPDGEREERQVPAICQRCAEPRGCAGIVGSVLVERETDGRSGQGALLAGDVQQCC